MFRQLWRLPKIMYQSMMSGQMDGEREIYLCYDVHHEKECRIPKENGGLRTNMFVTLTELHDALGETGKLQKAGLDKQSDLNKKTWKWQQVEGCELYYIFVFNKDGVRLPEHDTIAPQGLDRLNFKNIPDMAVEVLPLFKTDSTHGFVKIVEVRGLKDYDLVVDLSIVKNENRKSTRRSPTHFGFLCSSGNTYRNVTRVAAKKKVIQNVDDEKRRIDLALEAGGRFNSKYLACTKIEPNSESWIVMELGIKTFDVLITEKKDDQTYLVDENTMKICFRQILRGLIHLHGKSITHGSMKLTNILLSLDGSHLKIAEYDDISQHSGSHNDLDDIGNMFLKCLKRLPNCDVEGTLDEIRELKKTPETKRISERWINMVTNVATWERVTPLSAYLLMHVIIDRPEPEEILQHPFFWNELKILDFITRMDAWFHEPLPLDQTYSVQTVQALSENRSLEIKREFHRACKVRWPNLNWIEELKTAQTHGCDDEVKGRILRWVSDKNANKKEKKEIKALILKECCYNKVQAMYRILDNKYGEAKKKSTADIENMLKSDSSLDTDTDELPKAIANMAREFNPLDITRFLRLIRNQYAHYHQPFEYVENNKTIRGDFLFASAADLWKFFGNVLPEMIILLHRVVWLQAKTEND